MLRHMRRARLPGHESSQRWTIRTIGNIDVALLRTFVAVAETGQITRAAARLNLTQSAASQQIARLEALMETQLLERSANRVCLSREGEKLYSHAVRMIRINDEIMRDMRQIREIIEIRLGVPHDLVERFTPEIVRNFVRSNPEVEIKLVSLASGRLQELFEQNEIDMTLTTEQVGAGLGEVIMQDRLVWVGAKDSRAATTRPLIVTLGDDGDKFREPAINALSQAGIAWRQINQIGSLGSVLAMLAADMAVAPFLASTVPPFLTIQSSADLPELPLFQINLYHRKQDATSSVLALAEHIRVHFRKVSAES